MKDSSIDPATISALILQEDPIALYSDEDGNADEYDSEPFVLKVLRLRRELCESSRTLWRSLSPMTRNAPIVASARLSSPSIS